MKPTNNQIKAGSHPLVSFVFFVFDRRCESPGDPRIRR